jgi:hypothetical protein
VSFLVRDRFDADDLGWRIVRNLQGWQTFTLSKGGKEKIETPEAV